jgi:hypothetical protein
MQHTKWRSPAVVKVDWLQAWSDQQKCNDTCFHDDASLLHIFPRKPKRPHARRVPGSHLLHESMKNLVHVCDSFAGNPLLECHEASIA